MTPVTSLHLPRRARLLLLAPVLSAALWSLLASSTFEEGEPPLEARVEFSLSTITGALVIDDGTILASDINLRVAGNYSADEGSSLTIARDNLNLNATTTLQVDMAALRGEDDDLTAVADLDVTSPLLLNFGENPSTGQVSVLEDGTTTLATVQTDPDGVNVVTGSNAAGFFSWDDFLDAGRDSDQARDVRVASIAYEQLNIVLQLARIAEDLVEEIESNKRMLERMGLDQPLEIPCDEVDGERVLVWRQDAPGTGQGEIGEGDGFETSFDNCFDRSLRRYLKGTLALADYLPTQSPERALGGDFSFAALFISEDPTSLATVPSPTSPRVNGTLDLAYDEIVIEPVDDPAQ